MTQRLTIADLPPEICRLMEGPRPPDDFVSDGVTAVVDQILGIDTRAAGHWHDWAYTLGGDAADRKLADQRLYRNFRHCDLGKVLSQLRYLGVRLFGASRFAWGPKRPNVTVVPTLKIFDPDREDERT